MKRYIALLLIIPLLVGFSTSSRIAGRMGGQVSGTYLDNTPNPLGVDGLTFYKDFTTGSTDLNADYSIGSPVAIFTHTSGAYNPNTYVDKSGMVKYKNVDNNNTPVMVGSYYNQSGFNTGSDGIRIEPDIVNYVKYSSDFSQSEWTKTNTTYDLTANNNVKSSFETNSGDLLEGFEDKTDWSLTGAGCSVDNDTTDFISGSQSLKLTVDTGVTSTITKTIAQTISGTTNFIFFFYIADNSNITSDAIKIELSSTADFSKSMSYVIDDNEVFFGWNRFVFNAADFTVNSGESWSNEMIRIKFTVVAGAGGTVVGSFDDLRTGFVSRPKIIFNFDNAYDSVYDNAYPLMDAYNFKGVLPVNYGTVLDGIDSHSPYVGFIPMNLSELKELYNKGWDICNHTKDHKDIDTLNQATVDTQINDEYYWLLDNGFDRSAKYFVYPGTNPSTIAKVRLVEENNVFARIGNLSTQPIAPMVYSNIGNLRDMRYMVKNHGIYKGTTLNEVESLVDRTITCGGVAIFYTHDIQESPSDYGWTITKFSDLLDYIKTKVDANLVDVITFNDYYNSFSVTTTDAPDGTKIDKCLTATDANGKLTFAKTDGTAHIWTASIWIKRKTGTGTINLRANTGDAYTDITSYVGSSWTRVSVTSSSLTNPTFDLQLVTSGDAVWIWGAQLEYHPGETSYIPSYSVSREREEDLLKYINLNNRTKDAETIVIKFIPFGNFSADSLVRYLMTTDTKERILYKSGTSDQTKLKFYSNGTDSTSNLITSSTAPLANTSYIISAVSYGSTAAKNSELYINTTSEGTDNDNYTIPSWGTYTYIGSKTDGTGQINGIIQKVAFFNRALTSSEITKINTILNQ